MEGIGQFISEIAKRGPRTLLTPEQQLDKMLHSSDYLQTFLRQYPGVEREVLLRSLSTVYTAVKENYWCQNCPGLEKCPNMVKGHYTQLSYQHTQVVGALKACDKQLAHEEEMRTQRLIRSYYISEETLQADFETMIIDQANSEAVKAAIRFSGSYQPGTKMKGLFLHGPFGVGKSYIMGAVARMLSTRNIASLMVYVPDFIRELKDALSSNQSYNSKLEILKEIPVLILDDLGAENVTPWVRDEILGAILHHRVNNHLPTLYTSNYSLDELEEHLAISNGNRIETTKARRIMERVRHYVDVYAMEGANRRRESTN